jgi:hypothetical protein
VVLAEKKLNELIEDVCQDENYVYLDTIISPSYTSAIAQAIQIPGIAGMENNMVIFEYNKENPVDLPKVIDNFGLVNSGKFDVCILASSNKSFNLKKGLHIWLNSFDTENANLMILLSFIILGHPDLKQTEISIFVICEEHELQKIKTEMKNLVVSGRLPITEKSIKIILQKPGVSKKHIICERSANAGLTFLGLREELIKHEKEKIFEGYEELGTILFVHSKEQKSIS